MLSVYRTWLEDHNSAMLAKFDAAAES